MLAFGLGGAGVIGLTYLSYQGHMMRRNATPQMQLSLFHPTVQQRIQSTMGWFSGACMTTGGFIHMFRNNQRMLNMNPWMILGLSIASLIGTQMVDY
jgi:hypothetical protein